MNLGTSETAWSESCSLLLPPASCRAEGLDWLGLSCSPFWKRYLRQTLSWLPGGSGLVTVRPRCCRVTRGKWSWVLPRYFSISSYLASFFEQLSCQLFLVVTLINGKKLCLTASGLPRSIRSTVEVRVMLGVVTATHVIQQLLCRLANACNTILSMVFFLGCLWVTQSFFLFLLACPCTLRCFFGRLRSNDGEEDYVWKTRRSFMICVLHP